MENPPTPGSDEESDPMLDALHEIMNTMGGDAPITDRVELHSRTLLDVNTEFPGLDAEALTKNAELAGQIRKYAELYDSPDLTERAEARRFLKLLLDFSTAIHEGRAGQFDEHSHRRFLGEPIAPEELQGGIVALVNTLQGEAVDHIRERYDLPPPPSEVEQPSLFEDDERNLAAIVLDTWLYVNREAARQNKLLSPGILIGPADVRAAILEAALVHDYLASGTPAERIGIVDRVLTKLPIFLQAVLTEQRDQRSGLQGDIENL